MINGSGSICVAFIENFFLLRKTFEKGDAMYDKIFREFSSKIRILSITNSHNNLYVPLKY